MISDLVAGHAYWFQCAACTATGLFPFSTSSQMVTTKAPPTAAGLPFISPRNQTVVVKMASILASAFLRIHNFDCLWHLDSTVGKVSQFVPWTFVEGLQQDSRSISEVEYPRRSSLQDGNVSLEIGIGSIVVHNRLWSTTPTVPACCSNKLYRHDTITNSSLEVSMNALC